MLKIYFMLKTQYLKTEMEYTFNFWMMVFSGILMQSLMLAVPFVIFRSIPTIAGWTEPEVYLIMSFMFISEGLCNLLFDGIWHLPRLVFDGRLDLILSRPFSPLFEILSFEVGLQGVGNVALGLFSMLWALSAMGALHIYTLLHCLLFLVCGTAIRMSVYLASNSLVFWFDSGGSTNLPYIFFSVGEYAKYPVNIYPKWMQFVLMVLVPSGFIGFVPALILRGNHALLLSLLLVGAALLFFLLARTVFYRGIKHYESMGM